VFHIQHQLASKSQHSMRAFVHQLRPTQEFAHQLRPTQEFAHRFRPMREFVHPSHPKLVSGYRLDPKQVCDRRQHSMREFWSPHPKPAFGHRPDHTHSASGNQTLPQAYAIPPSVSAILLRTDLPSAIVPLRC
jgi:hypothetical protein